MVALGAESGQPVGQAHMCPGPIILLDYVRWVARPNLSEWHCEKFAVNVDSAGFCNKIMAHNFLTALFVNGLCMIMFFSMKVGYRSFSRNEKLCR